MEATKGATVAITAKTRSSGTVKVCQLLNCHVPAVHVLSRHAAKWDRMRPRVSDLRLVLGDVCTLLIVPVATVGTDSAPRPAAVCHVASCEFHPGETVKTDVIGSENATPSP